MTKPRVLVLGGLGFIGRNFVQHLVENDLASHIRVVDKTMIAMARLGKVHQAAFDKGGVEVLQVKLITADNVAKAFHDGAKWDICVNLAGETGLSLDDKVYDEGVTNVSVLCGQEAAKTGVGKYIEVSDARVYENSTSPKDESGKLKPHTGISKAKLEAENKLKAIPGLNLVVVRPALVYGHGDVQGLAPRIVFGILCKLTKEQMPLPGWLLHMKCHTVNVKDVSAALWHVGANANAGDVFNLADSNDSELKKINDLLEQLFAIKIDEMGSAMSLATRAMSAKKLAGEVNGDLVPKWGAVVKEGKCDYTPLTPYLSEELLQNNPLAVDGTAITKTGFSYKYPQITVDVIKEQISAYADDGWLPAHAL